MGMLSLHQGFLVLFKCTITPPTVHIITIKNYINLHYCDVFKRRRIHQKSMASRFNI
jgi:hypothetical protein